MGVIKSESMRSSFVATSVLLALLTVYIRTVVSTTGFSCDLYSSCAPGVEHVDTCFCDHLCRVYGDCCRDYVDEEEDDRRLTPLPSQFFTCRRMFAAAAAADDKNNNNYNYNYNDVYIITECPAIYGVQFVRDGCRHSSDFDVEYVTRPGRRLSEIFYVLPVTGRSSGLVYRNVYCAKCHGEEDVAFWKVSAGQCGAVDEATTDSDGANVDVNVDDLVRQESFSSCKLLFSPPSDLAPPRRCVDSVSECRDGADVELLSRCTHSAGVAYVYQRHSQNVYRNRDCAACNLVADYELCCNSSCKLDVRNPPSGFESFVIVFDMNAAQGSAVGGGSGGSGTQKQASCPDGHVYDPFAGTCRAITCPPGHSFTNDGQCRPETSKTAFHPDCAWIKFGLSEYRVLLNESIYVPLHGTTYDAESYRLDDNRTAYVCTSFQSNYTELVHEALRVDAVGTYLSVICSVVSLAALAFQFAVYMAFPVLRNTPGRCVVCLVVSLFVGQLLFILVKTGSSVSPGFCFGQAATMHYAFMAAFFWMNVMAFDVYRTFGASPGAAAASSSPSSARRRFAAYSAYSWASAATVVVVGVALDLADVGGAYRPHYGRRICWFGSRAGLLVLFGAPVGALLAANVLMFALSVRHIRSASRASQMAVQKTDQTQLLVSNLIL